ncbi:MAG: hypothetical protein U1F64_09545 [Burkholderiales bacterium]
MSEPGFVDALEVGDGSHRMLPGGTGADLRATTPGSTTSPARRRVPVARLAAAQASLGSATRTASP